MSENSTVPAIERIKFCLSSEKMVLGCCLNSKSDAHIACELLDDVDFYFPEHQTIFRAILGLVVSGSGVDPFLVSQKLAAEKSLDGVGGPAYVSGLALFSGTSACMEDYVEILQNKSLLRRCLEAVAKAGSIFYKEGDKIAESLERVRKLFYEVGDLSSTSIGFSLADVAMGKTSVYSKTFIEELEDRQRKFKEEGRAWLEKEIVSSGFVDFDRKLGGLRKSNLIVLAGRPGSGKSTFAMNIAEKVSLDQGLKVLVFHLEMGCKEVFERMIASRANLAEEKIKYGDFRGEEYQQFYCVWREICSSTLNVVDEGELTLSEIRAMSRRYKEVHGLDLVVIDHLGLIKSPPGSKQNLYEKTTEISKGLKVLAKDLDVPVLALCQLNRKVEDKEEKKPSVSHLRDSGSIEQDADSVCLIYRPETDNPLKSPGMGFIVVGKNRHGATGEISLCFSGDKYKFYNYYKEGKNGLE